MIAAFLLASAACREVLPQTHKAVAFIAAGKLEPAAGILQALSGISSECAAVLVAQGRLELARANYDQANRLSEQALTISPDDPAALSLRGQMLAMQGRADEGRALLERSVKLNAGDAEAWFQLGVAYDRAKRSDRAAAAFQSAAKLRPNDPRVFDYLALNLEPLGELARAEDAYKSGLAVNREPPLFDFFLDYNYGRLLLKQNRLQESKLHLDKALKLVPRLRATHYDRAKLNLRLGNLTEARADAEKALEISDDRGLILDLQVYNLLAQICQRQGDEEMAKKYSELSQTTRVPLKSQERR